MKFYKDHYEVVIIGGALAGNDAGQLVEKAGLLVGTVVAVEVLPDVPVGGMEDFHWLRSLFVQS